jgi:hypothetical protein
MFRTISMLVRRTGAIRFMHIEPATRHGSSCSRYSRLCEHDGATADDRRALAALVDQLPEAMSTAA